MIDAVEWLRALVDKESMGNRLVNRYYSHDVAQVCVSTRSHAVIKRVFEGREGVQAHHDEFGIHGRRFNVGKDIEVLKKAIGLG